MVHNRQMDRQTEKVDTEVGAPPKNKTLRKANQNK